MSRGCPGCEKALIAGEEVCPTCENPRLLEAFVDDEQQDGRRRRPPGWAPS